jgi:hypothetical protein
MTRIRAKLLELKEELVGFDRVYAHDHGKFMTVERQNSETFESLVFIIVPDFKQEFEEDVTVQMEG